MRNLSEPEGRDDTSPREKLEVELLESYQSPRQLLACTPCPSFSGTSRSFTSVSLIWSIFFFFFSADWPSLGPKMFISVGT